MTHCSHPHRTMPRPVAIPRCRLAALCAALLVAQPAAAQAPAQKSARFVVNIAPGGIVDAVARVVAQRLPEVWGQPVVVDNRPGASGNIGAEMVARAAPDGLTWLVTLDNVATVNANLYSKLSFDPARDLAPVTMLVVSPLVMVVNPALPVRSVRDLVQLARSRPGEVRFATAGSGTPQHFAGILLASLAGIRIEHIPYKGSIPAITDVASGQVELMVPSFTAAVPLMQAKKVRALAVTSAQRLPTMPDLPTAAESGVPGYEVNFWVGMFAPGRTAPETIRAAQQAVGKVLARPDVRDRLVQDVMLPVGNTPEELAKIIRADATKWAALIKQFDLRAE
jgi:tripartite-type tricarboxylate transporter receptor subunit TctC